MDDTKRKRLLEALRRVLADFGLRALAGGYQDGKGPLESFVIVEEGYGRALQRTEIPSQIAASRDPTSMLERVQRTIGSFLERAGTSPLDGLLVVGVRQGQPLVRAEEGIFSPAEVRHLHQVVDRLPVRPVGMS